MAKSLNQIEKIRLQALAAVKENTSGHTFIGSIREALRYGYEKDSNEGITFIKFFRAYEDALDIQVDENGYVI